ncbi:MAG: hypothetical protein IT204_19400 [Fimbriimonadaceae bacterium]|nr:hypothetical protein [Fimbriimonadaceae bacterium]
MGGAQLGRVRRYGLALLLAAGALSVGCSANGGGSDGLIGEPSRSASAMDGFVFVPSRGRQTATGDTSIPHALIRVFVLPRTPGDTPVATTQADARGFYRLDGLPINVPLLVVATDPFDSNRVLRGAISFGAAGEEKQRNITPTSTVAASILENRGTDQPVTDSQVAALEQIADAKLDELDDEVDITTDEEALAAIVEDAADESFGTVVVSVFSDPVTRAALLFNGVEQARVNTALPPEDFTGDADRAVTVSGNTVTLTDVPIGTAELRVVAGGFEPDFEEIDVQGGATSELDLTLLPSPVAGADRPPVILQARVLPQTLPFQGGTVAVQAQVRDPEGEAVEGLARVALSTPNGDEEFDDFDMTAAGDWFSANVTVPGNPHSYAQVYLVRLEFVSAGVTEPTRRLLQFSVSNIDGPPNPPEDDGARLLVGTWTENQTGPDPDHLTPNIGTPDVLQINPDATFQLTTDGGAASGRVEVSSPSARGRIYETDGFLVVITSNGLLPPAGTRIPANLHLLETSLLQTILNPDTPQQVCAQWTRPTP